MHKLKTPLWSQLLTFLKRLPSTNNLNYQSVAVQQCKPHVNIEIYQRGSFQTNNKQEQI